MRAGWSLYDPPGAAVIDGPNAHAFVIAVGYGGHLQAFSIFWALAKLNHSLLFFGSINREVGYLQLPLFLSALAALLWPGKRLLVVSMCLLDSAIIAITFPRIANHHVLSVVCDMSVVSCLLLGTLRRNQLDQPSVDTDGLVRHSIAPSFRAILISVYAVAALNKANIDFFHGTSSCACGMAQAIQERFGLQAMSSASCAVPIWGAFLFEASIPLLLAFRRTRKMGITTGAIIHFVWALHPIMGVADFSLLVLIIYVLILPPGGFAWVEQILSSSVGFRARCVIAFLVSTVFILELVVRQTLLRPFMYWSYLLPILGGLAGVLIVAARKRGPPGMSAPASSRYRWVAAIASATVIFVGTSPYWGFRNALSFSMFSNLRTYGPGWNHLFIPKMGGSAGGDDLVLMESTTNEGLSTFIQERPGWSGNPVPFRSLISFGRGWDGLTRFHRPGSNSSQSLEARAGAWYLDGEKLDVPFWISKFANFRAISAAGRETCKW